MFARKQNNLTIQDYIDLLNASSIIYDAFFDPDDFTVTAYPFDDARIKPLKFQANEQELLEEVKYYYKIVKRREAKLKRQDILWAIFITYIAVQNALISLGVFAVIVVTVTFYLEHKEFFQ